MFKCARLSDKDIPELMLFHDTHCVQWNHCFSNQDVKQRLKNNHRCFIAKNPNNEIIGFFWQGANNVYSPDLHCVFYVDDKSLIDYNGFFHPEFRGRSGLFNILQYAYNKMAEDGFKKAYGYIRSDNIASIKTYQRIHPLCKIVGKIYYGYVLGYYVFIPLIDKDSGIRVERVINPWYKWHNLLLQFLGKKKAVM